MSGDSIAKSTDKRVLSRRQLAGMAVAGIVGTLGLASQARAGELAGLGLPEIDLLNGLANPATIVVSGHDSVVVEPDKANISLGVTCYDEAPAAASTAASTAAAAITEAILAAGVAQEDLRTSNASISPNYIWDEFGKRSIDNYQATVSFTLSGIDVDLVAGAISAALGAGATSVDSLAYFSSSYDEVYNEALAKAYIQAQGRAQALANAAGTGLGRMVSVDETQDSQMYRYANTAGGAMYDIVAEEAAAADMGAFVEGAIAPGTIEIEASVTVTYEVKA